ncbi:MAG TPA: exodeoxyribonuclease VII small subunit [Bacillota bacterium]|nr:exodeoxyribonuclease VII small subunit [Bacillota bacterium]
MSDNNKEKEPTYEEAIKRLEEIVRRLEDENIPLEESLACFQEGIRLSRYCREKLAQIEFQVEYLLKEEQLLQEDHLYLDEGEEEINP